MFSLLTRLRVPPYRPMLAGGAVAVTGTGVAVRIGTGVAVGSPGAGVPVPIGAGVGTGVRAGSTGVTNGSRTGSFVGVASGAAVEDGEAVGLGKRTGTGAPEQAAQTSPETTGIQKKGRRALVNRPRLR